MLRIGRTVCVLVLAMAAAWGCSGGGNGSPGIGEVDGNGIEVPASLDAVEAADGPDAPDLGPLDTWEAFDAAGLFGSECGSNADCLPGRCVESADGLVCTLPCDMMGECPEGWSCKCPDPECALKVCLPLHARLCMPCMEDADCLPNLGNRCVDLGQDGHFCGALCGATVACPAGYKCQKVTTVGGGKVEQCVVDGGQCECSPLAASKEASTECFVENDIGTCLGTRICTGAGLTSCDAAVPAVEACNGKDDDCNGETDEGFGETSCGVGVCEKTVQNCQDGQAKTCNAMEGAAEEACDALDNDCDAATDEDFPDGDGNGFPDCIATDVDADGVADGTDNCPDVQNEDQANFDLDLPGDACDDDDDNDGTPDLADCAATDPAVFPDALEVCNGKDDDCDFGVDEELGETTCGLGECLHSVANCTEGVASVCDPMEGAADETCDDLDNDCDGDVDEGFANSDGDELADCLDPDDDNDGHPDDADNCPLNANPGQEDADADGFGDPCDLGCWLGEEDGWEADCDGLADAADNCPMDANADQLDSDGDLAGDACDNDDDGDGALDTKDNCPLIPNQDQADLDKDSIGDACDKDVDGDKVLDTADNCPGLFNPQQLNKDGDAFGNDCDDDDDNDGTLDPDDCGPLDASVHPGAFEMCNGKDDDCNQAKDEEGAVDCKPFYADADGDGFGTAWDPRCLCAADGIHTTLAYGDCQPDNPDAYPEATEVCNALDDDCDGTADEDFGDLDKDGIADCQDEDDDGDSVKDTYDNCPVDPNGGQQDYDKDKLGDACDEDDDGDGAEDMLDCDPLDPQRFPLNPETCDGKDNDCDGVQDDGLGETSCGKGTCLHTIANCFNGEEQTCDPMQGAGEEKCNGKDDDCDGDTDEELGQVTCGKGICLHTVPACFAGVPQVCDPLLGAETEKCNSKDDDCDGSTDEQLGQTTCGKGVCTHTVQNCIEGVAQTCDPMQGAGAETCNGKDDDCDGSIDQGFGQTTCGKGVCLHTVDNCKNGAPQTCDPMQGAGTEVCDGKDNDCDGETDETFTDTDGDGQKDCVDADDDNDGTPDGSDCDPKNPNAHPGGKETCDGADNDCNGATDEGCPGVVTGKSCKEIHTAYPGFQTGKYTIDPDGAGALPKVEVFCDMTMAGGGWMRVADVDPTKDGCPSDWVLNNLPVQVCRRLLFSAGCKSTYFNNFGVSYGEVRGYVRAYQYYAMDSFHMNLPQTIDANYVDGLSLTYGANPRSHIWTYAVGLSDDYAYGASNCPCAKAPGWTAPTFVGTNYYCESGNSGVYEDTWYTSDPLFDGLGCPSGDTCCSPAGLPWFQRTLAGAVTSKPEARLCADESSAVEDIGVYRLELYVR